MIPDATARLRFREMTEDDLPAMLEMLGDPRVMTYYPAPLDRDGTLRWIRRQQERYAEDGFGLWVIETHDGGFLGDCGLTWQPTDGGEVLEIGYHLRPDAQGHGYATEAAAACRDAAREQLHAARVSSIVHIDNTASRRVAERVGMHEDHRFTNGSDLPCVLMTMEL